MKIAFLIHHAGHHKLVPWLIPEENEEIFDPVQEYASMVITELKNLGTDYRKSEYIQTVIIINDTPVLWPYAEHLLPRIPMSPEKRAERQRRLDDLIILAGQFYDNPDSDPIFPSDKNNLVHH